MSDNKFWIKLGVGVGCVGILGFMAYQYLLSKYSIKPNGATITGYNIATGILDVTVHIQLTSDIGLSFVVKDLELDVVADGLKIADISNTDNTIIPNYGAVVLNIPIKIDTTQIVNNAVSLTAAYLGGGGIPVRIIGYSMVYIKGIPFGFQVNIDEIITLNK